jgi:uncharacterized protein DUF6714
VNADTLRALIADAWADVPMPAPAAVSYDASGRHLECNMVAEFFAGRRWTDITLGQLQNQYPGDPSACLSFMSPEAFRYYLPVYMAIAIDRHESSDLAAEAAVAALTPSEDASLAQYQATRWAGFNRNQREAIVAFLAHVVAAHGDDWGIRDPALALDHWSPR